MDFMIELHSGIRWLIVLNFVIIIVKFAMGMMQNGTFGNSDTMLLRVLNGLVSLQFLLGLGLVFPSKNPKRWEHMVTMVIAIAVVAMTTGRTRRAVGDANKFRTGLIGTVIATILIVLGVFQIGGW